MDAPQAVWTVLFVGGVMAVVGAAVWGLHRLTAPTARRLQEGAFEAHWKVLAARGAAAPLPRRWRCGGLAVFDRTVAQILAISIGWTAIGAGAYLVFVGDDIVHSGWLLTATLAATALVILLVGWWVRRTYARQLTDARGVTPAPGDDVTATETALSIPLADGRRIERAWSDWRVADRVLAMSKHGAVHCESITLSPIDDPAIRILLLSDVFDEGPDLIAAIVARTSRG